MSINSRRNKEMVVQEYNRKLFSDENEQRIGSQTIINKSHIFNAEQKKPDTKKYTLAGPMYIKFKKRLNQSVVMKTGVLDALGAGDWEEGRRGF